MHQNISTNPQPPISLRSRRRSRLAHELKPSPPASDVGSDNVNPEILCATTNLLGVWGLRYGTAVAAI